MEKPYRIATDDEFKNWGGSRDYDLLVGPDGFRCFLGEPEDRTWHRDAVKVVDELNRLYTKNMELKTRLDFIDRWST